MTVSRRMTMRERYDALRVDLLREYGVRVRKWRRSMSGVAWEVTYADGEVRRLIESPRPCGPMSAAIFCHEIGHHAIGFRRYRPRCWEEYQAWLWSQRTMLDRGLNVTPAVRRRVHLSLHYAVEKARRRGLRRLPAPLLPFALPPGDQPADILDVDLRYRTAARRVPKLVDESPLDCAG